MLSPTALLVKTVSAAKRLPGRRFLKALIPSSIRLRIWRILDRSAIRGDTVYGPIRERLVGELLAADQAEAERFDRVETPEDWLEFAEARLARLRESMRLLADTAPGPKVRITRRIEQAKT